MHGRTLACVAAMLGLAAAVAGCSEPTDDGGPKSGPRTLTIYSSLPLQGPERQRSRDMVNAIKLALQEAGGKIGALSITLVSLDDATKEAKRWTSDKVLDNARQAVRDVNAIAYIGERESAATALSLPLTNEGHILQVSPSSTYDGLTRRGGARQGEPDRFYPSGLRTFGRIVPADNVQASALAGYMKEEGVKRLALLADRDLYGGGLAEQVARAATLQGIAVIDGGRIDARSGDLAAQAAAVAAAGADAFLFAGATDSGAARIFAAVARADPDLLLFAPAGVADATFAGALAPDVQRRMRITTPTLPPRLLPPAARAFGARFRMTFGRHPEPDALQAFEATNAVLQSIRAAGLKGNQRRAVTDAFFAIRDRDSVLGTYSIDRYGDTSLSTYAGNRLRRGRLVLDKVLRVAR
jgi:branched-chain amino acid transport system substrate-binding protein